MACCGNYSISCRADKEPEAQKKKGRFATGCKTAPPSADRPPDYFGVPPRHGRSDKENSYPARVRPNSRIKFFDMTKLDCEATKFRATIGHRWRPRSMCEDPP